ncbi:hypothetical protein JHK85_044530 [Glycine max]|nr:hypothetical protein JHK85_044530 [Glycine max]
MHQLNQASNTAPKRTLSAKGRLVLQTGASTTIAAPTSWGGRFWGRTLCSEDSTDKFSCVTDDCGSGKLKCSGNGAAPPATLAEFTLDRAGGLDFFDVSLVDGYNVPMLVVPQGGSGEKCTTTGCVGDLNGACPSELKVMGADGREGVVACKSACEAFNSPQYCCSGAYGTPDTDQYVLYQRKRVGEVDDDRLTFEASTILSREIDYVATLEGIEMHMSSGAEKVVYPVGRKYMSAPSAARLKLVSSPELKAVFSIDDVKLPPWLDGMCLAEYLPNLEEYLGKQVLEAVSLIEVRRHFIEALSSPFGRPVEADAVFCRKATFLAASGVFTFLKQKKYRVTEMLGSNCKIWDLSSTLEVHLLIPTQFPKQQPAIMLQSSQHFNSQMAPMKSRVMSDYPWSPRWETSLMAERICELLADEALNFKRQCSEGQVQ